MKKYKLLMPIFFISLPLLAKDGWLGVSVDELTKSMKIALNVEYGLIVDKVVEGSPAEKANIQVGDILLKIDNIELEEFDALAEYVEDNPGKEVKIKIKRKQEIKDISVKLGERAKEEKYHYFPKMKKWKFDFFWPPTEKEMRKFERKIEELEKNLKKLFEKMNEKYEELPELKPKGKIEVEIPEETENI